MKHIELFGNINEGKVNLPLKEKLIWAEVVKAIPDFAQGTWSKEMNFPGSFYFSSDFTEMQINFIPEKVAKKEEFADFGFGACDENGDKYYVEGSFDPKVIIKGLQKGLDEELEEHTKDSDLVYELNQLVKNVGKHRAKSFIDKWLLKIK